MAGTVAPPQQQQENQEPSDDIKRQMVEQFSQWVLSTFWGEAEFSKFDILISIEVALELWTVHKYGKVVNLNDKNSENLDEHPTYVAQNYSPKR